jgi:hypothetical protein
MVAAISMLLPFIVGTPTVCFHSRFFARRQIERNGTMGMPPA